jgi:hypothetical protein
MLLELALTAQLSTECVDVKLIAQMAQLDHQYAHINPTPVLLPYHPMSDYIRRDARRYPRFAIARLRSSAVDFFGEYWYSRCVLEEWRYYHLWN